MRFYTTPPNNVNYPFLLTNPKNRTILKKEFSHSINDSGVLVFHNKDVKEYPEKFLSSWKQEAVDLTNKYGEKVWCVIPDYPDDINPGQFGDNVKKTLGNIETFIIEDKVNWVISLQARILNPFSFAESVQGVHDIIGKYPRIAIGTVCKTNNINFIESSVKFARRHFSNSWIHAFGLTLKALPKVKNDLDSFDSTAWTFPRGRGRGSCKNQEERNQFFNDYLDRISEITRKDEGVQP